MATKLQALEGMVPTMAVTHGMKSRKPSIRIGAIGLLLSFFGSVQFAAAQVTIFSENMGTPPGNTGVNAYTGWQNGAPITFSTTATTDVRTTNASSGYGGASGGGNVYMGTASGNFKDFLISGINTSGYTGLTLSFGIRRDANPANSLVVEVSADGITWGALSFLEPPSLNTWAMATASGTIPATANLRIRFQKNTAAAYRLDDIKVEGTVSGPIVNFNAATSSHNESAGAVAVSVAISPPPSAAGTISFTITGGTATYGVDYTTTPAAVANVVTVNVPIGATSASFNVNIVDDALNEADETITFSITGVTGGLNIGGATTHVLTIVDNDNTPTVEFGTLSVSALEGAGGQSFAITFTTPHPAGFTLTIQVTGTATYGAGNDFTTAPAASGGIMTLGPFSGASTGTTITATPLLDGLAEPTEEVIFTIISVSDPSFVIGPNNSATLHIGDIDSPPALFNPGDLVVVGVNANEQACGGGTSEDRISFFCFKEITFGTEIILTDNGYERCHPGQWGNGEGTVRMKRTGPAIPAGQVITFKISNTTGPSNVVSLAPDAAWSCTNINPIGAALNMNNGGDQLFFMQGGTWTPGTGGNNDATYDGTVLYAFSTNPSPPWTAICPTPSGGTQQSNLPPGVECFSTAPTMVSDFNKYVGPITAASQRDWIIRLDNLANWNSYGSCSIYNSTGYNWLSAPIMPILPGGMTHGLWRGAVNQDWFECKNWDDARIPDASTDVAINETAIRHCIVGQAGGLNPGGTASCASLLLNGTVVRNLTVDVGSTLNVGGRLLIDNYDTGNAGILTALVQSNGTINADSVRIKGYDNTVKASLQASADGSRINVGGDLQIDPGGRLHLQGSAALFGGTLELGGDFINKNDETFFADMYSQVILDGSGDQYIRNSNANEYFHNLRLSKPGGDVYLTAPITLRNELDLTQGRLFTTATELPTLSNTGAVVNASDASFVHGPFRKVGNTDFTFPIGKENSYRPASLSGITGGGSVAFTAEYFHHPGPGGGVPGNPLGLAHDATLHHVSDCEHWQIDRSNGSPNAFVTLSWRNPESCVVTLPADMRVAYWDGSQWTDRGGTPITGNNSAGTVTTANVQSSFVQPANYWTLASLSNENPLPIELLSFTAQAQGTLVDLEWSTASEKNNDYFTVERSADAVAFEPVLRVAGAGNSQQLLQYRDADRDPMTGLSYYRLRQTDYDGTSQVSDAVPVFFSRAADMTVLYGTDALYLQHGFARGSRLDILDPVGRLVRSTAIDHAGLMQLPLEGLAHGSYLLRLTDGRHVATTRLAY